VEGLVKGITIHFINDFIITVDQLVSMFSCRHFLQSSQIDRLCTRQPGASSLCGDLIEKDATTFFKLYLFEQFVF
jgi:hypothetical protein